MTWQATDQVDLRRGDRAAFFSSWLPPLLFIIHPINPKAQIWSRILKRTFGVAADGPTSGARKMTWQATDQADLRRGDSAAFFSSWLPPLLFIIHPW